jgi:multisubunit Na+/H+ antiporter MnhC subunit
MSENGGKVGETKADEARRKGNLVKAGIGLGIGSAAIAAALMYSNYAKKKAPTTPPHPEDAPPTD